MGGDITWLEYQVLKLSVWVRFVVVCTEGAGVTVGGNCFWWKSVETAKGVLLETVMEHCW